MILIRVKKNPAEKSEKTVLLKVDSSLWNYLGCQGKGEEGIEFVTGMVVNRLMCQLRLVKKILAILSCLDCLLKAWMYMVFRKGNMHWVLELLDEDILLRQDEGKNAAGESHLVCLQICFVRLFSVGMNIHSPLLAIKAHFNLPMELPNVFLDY